MPLNLPQTEITVDQIVADFGDYYLDSGQNENNLHMLPFESFDTKDAFTTVPTNETILREANVEVETLLQQYQDEFTPKGGVTIDPVQIPLYQVKIDQEFNPKKLQRTWLGFLTSNNTDHTTWPFIRWFVEMYLMKQTMEDIEMEAINNGVYTPAVEGDPGDADKVMNGARKIQDDLVAVGKLDLITMGAIAALPADFVTQVESFVKSIPEKFRNVTMDLNMNRTLRNKFAEGMRIKYNMAYNQINNRLQVADQENITVVGRPSMMNKSRIWCTPKYNALLGIKGFENSQAFQVEKAKRKVAIYTDWWMGIGYVQPKILFVSDTD